MITAVLDLCLAKTEVLADVSSWDAAHLTTSSTVASLLSTNYTGYIGQRGPPSHTQNTLKTTVLSPLYLAFLKELMHVTR